MLYLLADSRPLYCDPPITAHARARISTDSPAAAYLGAANCDEPAYYDMFVAAMAKVEIAETAHVHAQATAEEIEFLNRADLILLAGGHPTQGWQAFVESGVTQVLERQFAKGTPIMGVSAGAIQMGYGFYDSDGEWTEMFGWIPRLIDAHREDDDWHRLRRALERYEAAHSATTVGIGVSTGAALVWDPRRGNATLADGDVDEILGSSDPRVPMQLPSPY